MNSTCSLDEIIEWDIPNWSVALDYWCNFTLQNISSTYALEIGSRNGGLSLWAALNGMVVLCTDLEGPTNKATEKHRNYGVSDRIECMALNALEIPYAEKFDVVFFKSILGSIGACDRKDKQVKAINEMHKALKNGGEMWFAENLAASPFQ